MNHFSYELVKNPLYYKDNCVPAHSDHLYYESMDAMEQKDNTFRKSLNGLWKFHYAENYEQTIPGFEACDVNCKSWQNIHVPAHIQMEGYGEPQYANTQYPWEGHEEIKPGEIPTTFNPIGSYVKYFEIPEEMKGKRIFLSFQGAESGIAVWLNGTFLGYSEDSFTPSEFELTEYLTEGENKLACQVMKWTSGSWCEDQDFFRFSGIYRDVYLFAIPKVHVWDMKVQTILNKDFSAGDLVVDLLTLAESSKEYESRLSVKNEKHYGPCKEAGGQVKLTLVRNGKVLIQKESSFLDHTSVTLSIDNPDLWSAEIPSLYDLCIEVTDETGAVTEVIPYRVGFRRFELDGNIMKINGQRIVFKGVNRHEFSSRTGRCVSGEELVQDLTTMKQNNINAIRTSHYPNSTGIYELCDEYGIYMIAETNLETHGTWDDVPGRNDGDYSGVVPCDNMDWQPMLLDRVNSMYQRDKNHPSIVIWSCGNESFGGSVIHEMSGLFKQLDPSRLVHYEGIRWDRRYNDTSDMESQMYTPAEEIEKFLRENREKPFICCEYTHAMGNSCGGMHKYTDLSDREPLYQGGFIWDYIDQSISKKDRYGKEFQAYGGDFHDRPCDYNFSGNGIVYGGDRKPSPKMHYVKYNYQNITANVGQNQVEIMNKNLFLNTSAYDCVVLLERNGEQIFTGILKTDVEPLCSRVYELPVKPQTREGEYAITVSFRLKKDEIWAQKGHEVAYGQYVYKAAQTETEKCTEIISGETAQSGGKESSEQKTAAASKLTVVKSKHSLGVKGENFEAIFSYLNGGLASYKYGGREMIEMIPKPNFWRAPTDNDNGNLMPMRYAQWKIASMYVSHKTPSPEGFPFSENPQFLVTDEYVQITFRYYLPTTPAAECKLTYRVREDGEMETTLRYDPVKELGDMPEFGVMFKFNADYDNLKWYGLGPDETYVDRFYGNKLGIYSNKVRDNFARYLVPQECGNKIGVRWAELTDARGRGIRFAGDNMEFSALPWTPHEIENAMHAFELPEIHYIVVRVSKQQMGIGGDDSWGARTHKEFLLKTDEPMTFTFTFKGI